MTIVNSWNEWDQLKHVIVGKVDYANVPPMEPALEPKISKDSGMIGSVSYTHLTLPTILRV